MTNNIFENKIRKNIKNSIVLHKQNAKKFEKFDNDEYDNNSIDQSDVDERVENNGKSYGSRLDKQINDDIVDDVHITEEKEKIEYNNNSNKNEKKSKMSPIIISFLIFLGLAVIGGAVAYLFMNDSKLINAKEDSKKQINKLTYLSDQDKERFRGDADDCKDEDCTVKALSDAKSKEVTRAKQEFEKKIWNLRGIKIEDKKHKIKELNDMDSVSSIEDKFKEYQKESKDIEQKEKDKLKEKEEKKKKEKEEELLKLQNEIQNEKKVIEEENKKLEEEISKKSETVDKEESNKMNEKVDELKKSDINADKLKEELNKILSEIVSK